MAGVLQSFLLNKRSDHVGVRASAEQLYGMGLSRA